MKVLFIVTAYPRDPGDVITPWLVETIHRLRDRGVEVEVLAPSYRGLPSQRVEGVRVHRFRYAPRAWEMLTHDQTAPDRVRERPWYLGLVPPYVLAGTWAAARLARSGDFDLLHAFWPLPHGLLGLAAKQASGVPLISTFFGVELTWMESQLPFLRPVLRGIVRGSNAVTVISSYTAAMLQRAVPEAEPVIIPFGATVEVSSQDPLAPSEPIGSSGFKLLFVGRLVERKGVHVLLEALARVRRRHRVELKVVGDGPSRGALEARARELGLRDVVRFTGLVPDDELSHAFEVCDALVLPAVVDAKGDAEGLGVVLIEALGYGKPVIASALGGIVDVVKDGETGLLVPPNDPEALAGAISRYIEDPASARRLASRGREFVASEFSWSTITERQAALYRTVVSSAASRSGRT